MSGISSAIDTSLSGLNLFQTGINAVSNNLANQTTPGYAVETVQAQTAAGAPGQPGTGVQIPQITRAASGFAAALLRTANAASTAAGSQATSLTTISNALTNNGDVQSAINQFFADINTLAANPSSAAQRQTVLADAQGVTAAFKSAAGVLNGVVSGAAQTLSQSVTSANNLLSQLASLNQSLRLAPNNVGLLDQQQGALNALSSLLPVTALAQPNGSVILASGGTILLDQSGAQSLAVSASSPATVTAGSNATALPLGEQEGAIGAALAGGQAGTAALQSLGTLASLFAGSVNTGQAQGLTPSGAQGGPLFNVPAPSVTAAAGNTGGAALTAQITKPSALPIDGGPFTLTYTGAGWTATDTATGSAVAVTGTPPSFAGLTLAITGTPAAGDRFSVNPAPLAATGIAVAASSANAIAAADPYAATPGTLQSDGSILNNNGGTIAAGADSVAASANVGATLIPSSYFGQSLQLNFSAAGTYTVSTTASPGTAIASGSLSGGVGTLAIAYPAGAAAGSVWQIALSGSAAAGDVLTLTPGSSTSGSNAARLAALWTSSGTTSAGTLQQAVIGFGTGLGANAQAAQQLATASATQVTTATANLQTVSGVNTDLQAVNLTNYQQAYQAAAQAISVAHAMFESLIQAV
ncbi:MAG: flagellar biosynthesis protein FlgK [Rhodospirillales bacterium 20-64-7]|nr:MAG: flagellar biosynthesis protein FlgK [Rhodospirillales bacterium 20-64-7]